MLLRAVFHGVNFHEPVPPGRDTVSVKVYEPTADPKVIDVPSHIVIFQPNGTSLTVGEEYSVHNKSNPPQAYFAAAGNFQFTLPENAQLKQIAAADRKSTRLNSSHVEISYAVFCLKKKKKKNKNK